MCGESFPVGCRFSAEVVCAQFFSVNPDRRRRLYSTPAGMYRPGCGLAGTYMSWSAAEYLYMVRMLVQLLAHACYLPLWQRDCAWNTTAELFAVKCLLYYAVRTAQ